MNTKYLNTKLADLTAYTLIVEGLAIHRYTTYRKAYENAQKYISKDIFGECYDVQIIKTNSHVNEVVYSNN